MAMPTGGGLRRMGRVAGRAPPLPDGRVAGRARYCCRRTSPPTTAAVWHCCQRGRLEKLGALDSQKVVDGEWWRLFSSMWIHSGLMPLLVNILRLLIIGVPLERQFGSAKFGTLYLLSGVGASLVSCLYNHKSSSGASGAIFGLVGGLLSEILTNWTIYENKCAAFQPLIIAVVINISVVALPQADNYANIGGFIFGFLLGFAFLTRPQPGWTNRKHILPGHEFTNVKQKYKAYQRVLRFAALLLLIIGYVGCTVKVFHKAGT